MQIYSNLMLLPRYCNTPLNAVFIAALFSVCLAAQVVPLFADLRQSAVEFASALVAYAAGLEAQVCAAMLCLHNAGFLAKKGTLKSD